jgi:undecaprenyl-diphosphatase
VESPELLKFIVMPEQLDQQLFLFLNSHNSPFWDQVMHLISSTVIWIPLYLAIIVTLGIKLKRKFPVLILTIALAVTLSDQGSVLIKNSVQRLRPCHEPALEGRVHMVNGECGGKYGFVSSHACNSFMVALFSLLFIRKKWFTCSIISWAFIVGYSRIYLGVHYPGDVICGSLLGAIIGWAVFEIYKFIEAKYLQRSEYFNKA